MCVGWAVTHCDRLTGESGRSQLLTLSGRAGLRPHGLAFTMWVSGTSLPSLPSISDHGPPQPIRGRDLVRADQWEAGTGEAVHHWLASVWERLLLLDTRRLGWRTHDRQGEDNTLNHSSQIKTSLRYTCVCVWSFSFVKLEQQIPTSLRRLRLISNPLH